MTPRRIAARSAALAFAAFTLDRGLSCPDTWGFLTLFAVGIVVAIAALIAD